MSHIIDILINIHTFTASGGGQGRILISVLLAAFSLGLCTNNPRRAGPAASQRHQGGHVAKLAVHHFPSHQAFGQQQQQQQQQLSGCCGAQHAVQSFQLMFWSTTIKLLPPVRCTMISLMAVGVNNYFKLLKHTLHKIVETISNACFLCCTCPYCLYKRRNPSQ